MYNCKEKQNTNNSGVPIGTIINFFGDTAPEGYLSCDGTEYLKSDYPLLASHLASLTTANLYVGSDSDHFAVPDLRGEFLRGSGTNSHTNGGSGANVGVHQGATAIPMFRVPNTNVNDTAIYVNPPVTAFETPNFDKSQPTVSQGNSFYFSITKQTGNANGLGYVRPTNTSVLYCIKY